MVESAAPSSFSLRPGKGWLRRCSSKKAKTQKSPSPEGFSVIWCVLLSRNYISDRRDLAQTLERAAYVLSSFTSSLQKEEKTMIEKRHRVILGTPAAFGLEELNALKDAFSERGADIEARRADDGFRHEEFAVECKGRTHFLLVADGQCLCAEKMLSAADVAKIPRIGLILQSHCALVRHKELLDSGRVSLAVTHSPFCSSQIGWRVHILLARDLEKSAPEIARALLTGISWF
jgi:hypothetical protein